MEAATEKHYQAKEFAARAGVTVRTLHFYDRRGLLQPAARTPPATACTVQPSSHAWSRSSRCASSDSVSTKSRGF